MTPADLLDFCLAKPGAWPDEPWEGDVVAKVGDKIFAFLGSGGSVGVKCGSSREEADEWLLRYPEDASVMAYIGRSGWNTLRYGGAIPDDELLQAVDDSYAAVVAKLPRRLRPASVRDTRQGVRQWWGVEGSTPSRRCRHHGRPGHGPPGAAGPTSGGRDLRPVCGARGAPDRPERNPRPCSTCPSGSRSAPSSY